MRTSKGNLALVHENYMYRVKRKGRCKITWICCNSNCRSRAFSMSYVDRHYTIEAEFCGSHNHTTDALAMIRKRFIFKMKILMNELIVSTRECISKGLRGASEYVFVALRNPDSVAKTLRRYRSKLINPGEIMYEILGLGSSLTKTYSGETFYQFGPDNNRDIETDINFYLFY